MRFISAIATLALLLLPSALGADTTTTVTHTVVKATATSIITRSSGTAAASMSPSIPTSTFTPPSTNPVAGAAIASTSAIPNEYMGAASIQQGRIGVVVLAGAAAVALGL